jgi:hypothetical protein
MRFYNEPKYFFNNLNKLPDYLMDIIYEYIPEIVKIFLTKKSYLENHYLIRKYIPKQSIENYIRAIVRQDNHFVFKQIFLENYKRWLNMKKYYYRQCIYANYINFLESYAIEHDSTKCRQIMIKIFEELGLCKNQHKKKIINYIRWKN